MKSITDSENVVMGLHTESKMPVNKTRGILGGCGDLCAVHTRASLGNIMKYESGMDVVNVFLKLFQTKDHLANKKKNLRTI